MENNFKFYNTLTRQIDTVIPRVDGKIGMYTCGPTVYHFAHIGNIRSYIMEDVLEKALRYVGYDELHLPDTFSHIPVLLQHILL